MAVRNLGGIKPSIWIPPVTNAIYKLTVERLDGTVDDLTELTILMKVTDGVTDGIGTFEATIWNPSERFTDKWVGMESVRYYKDYATTATSLRFRGRIENVRYTDNKIIIKGRSESLFLMEKVVTRQYTDTETSEILSQLIDAYGEGRYTKTNINTSSTTLSVNWYRKPFWECVQELTSSSNFDCYVDANLDVHYFESGSVLNEDEGIVHDMNLISVGDFSDDIQQVRNKINVYGAQQDGIQILYSANDTDSQNAYGIREELYSDDNITTYEQAKEVGDGLLALKKDPPNIASVKGQMLATIQPGDKIRISSPDNNIPPDSYLTISYTDTIDINGEGFTTSVEVNKDPIKINQVFKSIIENNSRKQTTTSNPFEMEFSYDFLFDSDIGVHNGTEVTRGVLRLQTGQSSGTWISPLRTLSATATQAYLLENGTLITGASVEVSFNNGVSYQAISNKEQIDITSAAGSVLIIRVTITDQTTEIDSLSLQYKL